MLEADLVVDAMGRSARTPAFLDKLGYCRTVEHRAVMHSSAARQLLHVPDGVLSEKLTYIFPERSRPNLLALAAYEKSTWMSMVGCVAAKSHPPTWPQ